MDNVLIIVCFALVLINFVFLFIYFNKVKKYQKMYENSLAKFNNTANIKDKFVELFSRLDDTEKKCEETKAYCDNMKEIVDTTIKKVGLVKYNAYDDTENKLSFALALLNEKNDGVLLNHIYSKHGSSIYAKNVKNGKVEERISEEEAYALDSAMGEQQFTNIEVPMIKKVKTRNVSKVKKF